MSESDTSREEPQLPAEGGFPRAFSFWFVLTLLGSLLLAWLFGSASARIKLLGLFPLALGALTAFLSLELLKHWGLRLRKTQIIWITLMAILVSAGATYQAASDWHDQIWEERSGFIGEHAYRDFMKMKKNDSRDERYEYLQILESNSSFQAYLSHRLKAFSDQLGRETMWDSPVPEIVFAFEQLLAALGAFVVSVFAYRSQRRSTNPQEATS